MFYPAKPGVVGISEQDFAHHVVDSHDHTTSGDDDIVISGELFKKSAQLFWIIVALGNRGVCRADRKSTRLNSSHVAISYAVFCLKKKKSRAEEPPDRVTSVITHISNGTYATT